jgi:hypothetical protein
MLVGLRTPLTQTSLARRAKSEEQSWLVALLAAAVAALLLCFKATLQPRRVCAFHPQRRSAKWLSEKLAFAPVSHRQVWSSQRIHRKEAREGKRKKKNQKPPRRGRPANIQATRGYPARPVAERRPRRLLLLYFVRLPSSPPFSPSRSSPRGSLKQTTTAHFAPSNCNHPPPSFTTTTHKAGITQQGTDQGLRWKQKLYTPKLRKLFCVNATYTQILGIDPRL